MDIQDEITIPGLEARHGGAPAWLLASLAWPAMKAQTEGDQLYLHQAMGLEVAIAPLAFRVLVVVAQFASELKITLGAFLISLQQSDQAAAVGGTTAGGVQFNCCVEVSQR